LETSSLAFSISCESDAAAFRDALIRKRLEPLLGLRDLQRKLLFERDLSHQLLLLLKKTVPLLRKGLRLVGGDHPLHRTFCSFPQLLSVLDPLIAFVKSA
jgi:hypothetical protein